VRHFFSRLVLYKFSLPLFTLKYAHAFSKGSSNMENNYVIKKVMKERSEFMSWRCKQEITYL